MEDVKKIDVHAHLTPWPEFEPKYMGTEHTKLSPDEMFEKYYAKLNVERAILLPSVSPEALMAPISSSVCKYLSEKYHGKLYWFCNVDPRAITNTDDAPIGYLLEHYKSLGAKGVGEVTANMYADSPMLNNLFSACAELDLPMTIHIAPKVGNYYGIVDDLGLPRIEKMLKKHPKLKILGHSQCFWSEIGENNDEIRNSYPSGKVKEGRLHHLLRNYENLYCDLSAGSGANAFMRDREHAARFIEEFSDRLMYGNDICMSCQTFPFEFDEFLTSMRSSGEISEENYRKLVRENAIRILKL